MTFACSRAAICGFWSSFKLLETKDIPKSFFSVYDGTLFINNCFMAGRRGVEVETLIQETSRGTHFKSYEELRGGKPFGDGSVPSNFFFGRHMVGLWRNDVAMIMANSDFIVSKNPGTIEIIRKEHPFSFSIPEGTSQGDIELFLHIFLTVFMIQRMGREAITTAAQTVTTYPESIIDSKLKAGERISTEEVDVYHRYRDQILMVLGKLDEFIRNVSGSDHRS